jgi:hypothetical protein
MMLRKQWIKTQLGRVELAVLTCDVCQKQVLADDPDGAANWFKVRTYYGNADMDGDACCIEHLVEFANRLKENYRDTRYYKNEK